MNFVKWFRSEPHRDKYESDHPAFLAAREAWDASRKEALAQPEQEPVAWICEGSSPDEKHAIDYWPWDLDDLPIGTQLYTSPPPQRTWVGLTDEEIEASKPPLSNDAVVWELAVEWAQSQLKEKNT